MATTYTIPLTDGQDREESITRGRRMEAALAAGTLAVRKTTPDRKGFVILSDPNGDLFEVNLRCYCPDWLHALNVKTFGDPRPSQIGR